MDDAAFEVHPATAERWDDLADLFECRGPRGGRPDTDPCWCMFWRERTRDRERNRAALAALVDAGVEPGLLGYVGAQAVGWISLGPREEFGQLYRSPRLRPRVADERVFAIVCFAVRHSARRHGVAKRLLAAGIDYARGRGAGVLEAYAGSPGDYMGWPALYQAAGFKPVGTAGTRRVMRLALR
jgi:GNAT superfamily N-acetyltransferase